jgi:acyl carrier protein
MPDSARPDLHDGQAEPNTPMEILVGQVWREALGLDRVGVYDNFFDLGGHSLASVRVIAKLEEKTGVKMNPALIRFQTLGQLAAWYEEQARQPQAAPSKPAAGVTQRVLNVLRRAVSTGSR